MNYNIYCFVSVEKVKKKRHGLRNVFRKGLHKSAKEKSEGEVLDEFTSTWSHFNSMLFLKDNIEQ